MTFPDFPGRAGQASDAVSVYTQLKLEDAPKLLGCQPSGFVFHDPGAPNHGTIFKAQCERHTHWAGLLWEQHNCLAGRSHADTIDWSHDMEGHANMSVERNCEVANQKIKQWYKVSTPCLDDHQFINEGLETVGDLSNIHPQIILNCFFQQSSAGLSLC